MDIQDLINDMSAKWQRERAETQMTLGKMIAALEAMPEGAEVANLNSAHSYRGYYSDLAFEHDEGVRAASELLDECKSAMGHVFCGYKGGDYMMGALTPVWVARYGCCGRKLMTLRASGEMETSEND